MASVCVSTMPSKSCHHPIAALQRETHNAVPGNESCAHGSARHSKEVDQRLRHALPGRESKRQGRGGEAHSSSQNARLQHFPYTPDRAADTQHGRGSNAKRQAKREKSGERSRAARFRYQEASLQGAHGGRVAIDEREHYRSVGAFRAGKHLKQSSSRRRASSMSTSTSLTALPDTHFPLRCSLLCPFWTSVTRCVSARALG